MASVRDGQFAWYYRALEMNDVQFEGDSFGDKSDGSTHLGSSVDVDR